MKYLHSCETGGMVHGVVHHCRPDRFVWPLVDAGVPAPEIAAKDDGGICLEWDCGPVSYTAHLGANGGMYFCRLAESEADDRDREFDHVDIPELVGFFTSDVICSSAEAPSRGF